ncbi:MAG: HAMP domain-containing histidine kinase [Myxococcota bacterium]|nr:HAMP domain-containing histidine kinase [Myxococcota bacterium]
MAEPPKPAPPVRLTTDESLRAERRKTDAHLEGKLGVIKDEADEVVAEARDRADEVLSDAREREDAKLAARGLDAESLDEERDREDAALTAERGGADAVIQKERVKRQLALASLLARERQDTDLRLQIERTYADAAVSSRENVLAMVSHDLRSLLGGIALSADMLGRSPEARDPAGTVARHAERIQSFAAQMTRLVGDLVDAASIEAGRLSVITEHRDAADLVRDAFEAFQPAAAIKGVELTCEIGQGATFVEFDYERILQVLTNLVGNALKFTAKGGHVMLGVTGRGDDVCFVVKDTGAGVPADQLDRIFDRFYQTNRNDRRGLGLGLFIAKSIVEAHGGRIWVESTVGTGSTFFFSVPPRAVVAPAGAGPARSSG